MHHPGLENGPAGGLEIGRRVGWKPCRDVQRAGEWVGNPGTDLNSTHANSRRQSRQDAALISGNAATMLDATLMSGNAATMLDNTVM